MIGFIVSVFPFRNRVSSQGAFEGLELGEGKLSRPVLRGPGGRKAAWLLGNPFSAPAARDWIAPVPNARFQTRGLRLLASRVSASNTSLALPTLVSNIG